MLSTISHVKFQKKLTSMIEIWLSKQRRLVVGQWRMDHLSPCIHPVLEKQITRESFKDEKKLPAYWIIEWHRPLVRGASYVPCFWVAAELINNNITNTFL